MKKHTSSSDGTDICYDISGHGDTALLFSHGWLGNKDWWADQARAFESDYVIARIDLAGHGDSARTRRHYTAGLYADDIVAVAESVAVRQIILVGHSMSGAYVLEAALKLRNVSGIIVVDTLKDLELVMDQKILAQLFDNYRKDFDGAVRNTLPRFLFAASTPKPVVERLQKEFLLRDAEFAVKALEPLYKMDLPRLAARVTVPVRAINSEFIPTSAAVNAKYFRDYRVFPMRGTGHYPMLEDPETFNETLRAALNSL